MIAVPYKDLGLQIGYVLRRAKGGIFSRHYAIVIGFNSQNQPILAENQVNKGIRLLTLEEFLADGNVTIEQVEITRNNLTSAEQKKMLERFAQKEKNNPNTYNLFAYNCEHFKNEMLTGKAKSKQVENSWIAFAIALMLILAGLAIYFNSKKLRK